MNFELEQRFDSHTHSECRQEACAVRWYPRDGYDYDLFYLLTAYIKPLLCTKEKGKESPILPSFVYIKKVVEKYFHSAASLVYR